VLPLQQERKNAKVFLFWRIDDVILGGRKGKKLGRSKRKGLVGHTK